MAYIERIEVENEGFLGGLDVSLTPGLNVLIGARGTGKTSIIELIRYALDSGSFTTEAGARGSQQAIATLDGGAVTLTIRDGENQWIVTRTAEGITSSGVAPLPRTTVLAQSEIESIGVSPSGRLALIDRFLDGALVSSHQIRAVADATANLTTNIASALDELEKADEALAGGDETTHQLVEAKELQDALLVRSSATAEDQLALMDAQSRLSALAQRESQLTFARSAVEELRAESAGMQARVRDVVASISSIISDSESVQYSGLAEAALEDAAQNLSRAAIALETETGTVTAERARLDGSSREVRQRLDTAQEGLSQATRRVQQLEERKGQLEALRARRLEYVRRLESMRAARQESYEALSKLRAHRLSERQKVARHLSMELAPHIRVQVSPGSRMDSYTSGIVSSLRGSGLRYNNLAPLLASSVAPIELVEWAERSAAQALANATGVSADRASAIISAIRQGGASTIISADVEDEVSLELLDGPEYKPIEHLSIGQRCTVILPILLAIEDSTLVVDQPEDHLDNAFVTSTLISAIRARDKSAQTILSSHNANIPVLGNATQVVVLESDGEAGRVLTEGNLDSPAIVKAVSEIMEGGAEAFATRAQFYGSRAL